MINLVGKLHTGTLVLLFLHNLSSVRTIYVLIS